MSTETLWLQVHTTRIRAENEKSGDDCLFLILPTTFWYASHNGSMITDWLLFFKLNFEKKTKAETNTVKVLTNLTYEYLQCMNTPDFWGLGSRMQAHIRLMYDQLYHEDNFSPKKLHFYPDLSSYPLNLRTTQVIKDKKCLRLQFRIFLGLSKFDVLILTFDSLPHAWKNMACHAALPWVLKQWKKSLYAKAFCERFFPLLYISLCSQRKSVHMRTLRW